MNIDATRNFCRTPPPMLYHQQSNINKTRIIRKDETKSAIYGFQQISLPLICRVKVFDSLKISVYNENLQV